MTDPASLPDRLADAEGELPRAVNSAILAECDSPRICSVNGRVKEGIRCGPCEQKALFTILARLAAAESAREAAVAERDEAGALISGRVAEALRDADWLLEWLATEECESADPEVLCRRTVCQETGCVSMKRFAVREALGAIGVLPHPVAAEET
ncbi:hypothetical protein [Methylobacterium pseudosasicola]|uniref:hypothetical protein n=1 Tax=Methylobacterium pseudosasicola TaxID=582667 RepID=UPI0011135E2B|nr:hypothetical protein [Methylobacterium pseudosasicola]